MPNFARIENGVVAEIIEPVEGIDLDRRFPPDFVAALVQCDDDVQCGWVYGEGDFLMPQPTPEDLSSLKSALKQGVDAWAETERLKYITPGEGQAMTYQQKVVEARAFKIASSPKAADYPVLSSEVGITAETLSEVADVVLAAFSLWQQIGAAIEAVRLGAKRDIDAAANEAAARAIVDAIEWPQPAL
ncbi:MULTISPECIES: hypothetical protein [Brucella/Ochrobactrum group]|uniref:hypothetical protein n=1 Tax=unclassified Ochrobactrum TaxID=239106 RepID=UPI000DEEE0C4|nr:MULTISPECIES: hypothetical protein [Brucella/Ochrobactrum group]MBQ0707725.1 hypothetical protein [Ochrobactrum sp. AP1BH01-1]